MGLGVRRENELFSGKGEGFPRGHQCPGPTSSIFVPFRAHSQKGGVKERVGGGSQRFSANMFTATLFVVVKNWK